MENEERYSVQFYQKLGKLFYTIAATDKNVTQEEYDKLRELVKTEWLSVDEFEDDFHTDAAYQIEIIFDWLHDQKQMNTDIWFEEFIVFKEVHATLFNDQIKKRILKTAHAIAASFSGKNKSELIMLARLQINLRHN